MGHAIAGAGTKGYTQENIVVARSAAHVKRGAGNAPRDTTAFDCRVV